MFRSGIEVVTPQPAGKQWLCLDARAGGPDSWSRWTGPCYRLFTASWSHDTASRQCDGVVVAGIIIAANMTCSLMGIGLAR